MLARVPALARRTSLALVFALSVSTASAQTPQAPAPPAAAPSAAGTAGPISPGTSAGDTGPAPAPAPVREATGYAPSSIRSAVGSRGPAKGTKAPRLPKAATRTRTDRKNQTGTFVVEPGFELLNDGGSRFFVELAQSVAVEERKAKGTVTYVLKGARNAFRNNFNPLVTEHFNTPVRRAKLQPAGKDLLFVMELRQDVASTHRVVTNKEGHAVFQVDFGAGTFVNGPPSVPQPDDEGEDVETTTRKRRPGSSSAPVKGVGPTP